MGEYVLKIRDTEYRAEVLEITPDQARVAINGTEYTVDLVEVGHRAPTATEIRRTTPRPARQPSAPSSPTSARAPGSVTAPLPGLVLQVKVGEGDTVNAGDPLVVMEAMKMENVVSAPHNGTIRRVFVADGDGVGEGDPLVEIARPEMTTL